MSKVTYQPLSTYLNKHLTLIIFPAGVLLDHKWENAFTLDEKSWGFRRNMKITEILTIHKLLQSVVSTVSCGGKGQIAPILLEYFFGNIVNITNMFHL